jgi:hypothetical protein
MQTDPDSLQSVLLSDVRCAPNRETADGSSRRTAVRAVLAAVQGMLWGQRTLVCARKIRYLKPYCARHSSVSWNLMIGKRPLWIAKQHGHSITTMLSVYAAWADGSVESDSNAIKRAMASRPRALKPAITAQTSAPERLQTPWKPATPKPGSAIEAASREVLGPGFGTSHRQRRTKCAKHMRFNWRWAESRANPSQAKEPVNREIYRDLERRIDRLLLDYRRKRSELVPFFRIGAIFAVRLAGNEQGNGRELSYGRRAAILAGEQNALFRSTTWAIFRSGFQRARQILQNAFRRMAGFRSHQAVSRGLQGPRCSPSR